MTTETFTVIEYYELEDLFKEHLKEDISVPGELESGNDSYWTYDPRERRWGDQNQYGSGWKADLEMEVEHPGWSGKVQIAVARLCELKILSDEHRILVSIFW